MKKRKNDRRELNFWQPSFDLMTGLVLILILIIILLLLYLMYTPESIEGDLTNGTMADTEDYDGYGTTEESAEGNTWDQRGDSYDDGSGNGSNEPASYGGGSGNGIGIQPGTDEGIKSAVYVELVDAETLKIIRKEGVSFELYGQDAELETLNTYYPVKTSYQQFETTKEGVFYLPEKIFEGQYSLLELTVPEGYDSAGSVEFTVDRLYDWPEPLVVQVPLYPSRNIIRVQMTDKEEGTAVSGATFDVIAAQDITTTDGTVRYTKGQTVDTITLDEDGYGESKELYLGCYTLKQNTVPEYYASITETLSATVSQKTETETVSESAVVEAKADKTKVELSLADELTGQAIEGAEFEITNPESGDVRQAATDQTGRIVLTDLEKGASYEIRQIFAPENYRADAAQHTVTVSEDGRIEGKATADLKLTNRMLRVQIGVLDSILHRQIAGKQLILKKSDGTIVASWTTSGSPRVFTDLEEGTYSIYEDGQEDAAETITVSDTAELQTFNRELFTKTGILVFAGGAAAAVGMVALLAALIRKAGKRKGSKKAGKDTQTESETDGHKE